MAGETEAASGRTRNGCVRADAARRASGARRAQRMRSLLMRTALAFVVAVGAGGVLASSASAGQYTVHACGRDADFRVGDWTFYASDSRMSSFASCPTDGSGHRTGMESYAGIDRGTIPVFWQAYQ